MSFTRVIGQARPKMILQRAMKNRHLHHAYFFTGPEGVGKEALAIEFAKLLYCSAGGEEPCDQCSHCRRVGQFNHPDFFYLFPMPKEVAVQQEREILDRLAEEPYLRVKPWFNPAIGIDRIRELRRVSVLKPLERHRIVVIAEADKMTAEAANALLKILEEPPANMYWILTSSRPQVAPATIFSRCQEIRFSPLSDADIESALVRLRNLPAEQAKFISRIAQGNFRRALEWLEEEVDARRKDVVELLRICLRDPLSQWEYVEELLAKYDKRLLKDMLGLLMIWFRDVLVLRAGAGHETARNDLLVNADQRSVLEKFSAAFAEIGFDEILGELERAIDWMDRNVHNQLIWVVLVHRLQRHLILKGQHAH